MSTMATTELRPASETPAYSSWGRGLRDSLRFGRTRAGLVITGGVLLLALLGPLFAPHSPTEVVGAPFSSPSAIAPLGTDYVGEDVLSRVLWGGRSIVWMATLGGLIGVAGGTALGVFAGYGKKWVDELIMRSLDVVLALPVLVFVLMFIAMLGTSPLLIAVLVGMAWIPTVARTIRATTLELVKREFIEAAEVIGTPRRRILLHDVLPNLTTIILVEFGLRCAWSVALVSVLSYLGFGISPPKADWGLMVNENSIGIAVQPWGVVAPITCIALFSIGVSLVSDGLSQAVSGIDRRAES